MKIEIIEEPVINEFKLVSSTVEFIKDVNENQEVIVHTNYHTPKSVYISLQYRDNRFSANMYDDQFKMLENKDYSYLTGERNVSYHFKILKKQSLKKFFEYLEVVVNRHFKITESFTLKVSNTKVIDELRNIEYINGNQGYAAKYEFHT